MFRMLGGPASPAVFLVFVWLDDGASITDGSGCGVDVERGGNPASAASVATPDADSSELESSDFGGASPSSATESASVKIEARAPPTSWEPSKDELRRWFCLL